MERLLLSPLVAAPQLGETTRWLHAADFDDPDCAAIFAAVSTGRT